MPVTVTSTSKMLFRSFVCLCWLLTGSPASAFDCNLVPAPYEARYSVTRNGDPDGWMRVLLKRESDGRYSYSTETYVKWGIFTARIEQRSDLELRDGGIFPVSFNATQSVSIYRRRESVEFDWTALKARGAKKRTDFEMDIRPGMQDKLTVYLQLARLACLKKTVMDTEVVSGPVLKRYDYRLVAKEPLDTVLGNLRTIHIRRGSPDDDKQTDLWLAAGARFMPVKMVYRDDDIITDMRLNDISFMDDN